MPKIAPIEIDATQLKILNKLGEVDLESGELGSGQYGIVKLYQVTDTTQLEKFRQLGLIRDDDDKIAVKFMKNALGKEADLPQMLEFQHEADITHALFEQLDENAKKNPSHMLGCRGQIGTEEVIFCRLETGSLSAKTRLERENESQALDDPAKKISDDFINLMNGMDVLHKQRILHLDIAHRNILCTNEGAPILADFGKAQYLPEGQLSFKDEYMILAPMWVDHGFVMHHQCSAATDLYAIKMTMLEHIAASAGIEKYIFPLKRLFSLPEVNFYRNTDQQKLAELYKELEILLPENSVHRELLSKFEKVVTITNQSNIADNYQAEHQRTYQALFTINFNLFLEKNPDIEKLKEYIINNLSHLKSLDTKIIFLDTIKNANTTPEMKKMIETAITTLDECNKIEKVQIHIKKTIHEINATEASFRADMRALSDFFFDKDGKLKPDNVIFENCRHPLTEEQRTRLLTYFSPYRKLAAMSIPTIHGYNDLYKLAMNPEYVATIEKCIQNYQEMFDYVGEHLKLKYRRDDDVKGVADRLIMPVQRLPRLELFAVDLSKTYEGNAEKADLEQMKRAIAHQNAEINSRKPLDSSTLASRMIKALQNRYEPLDKLTVAVNALRDYGNAKSKNMDDPIDEARGKKIRAILESLNTMAADKTATPDKMIAYLEGQRRELKKTERHHAYSFGEPTVNKHIKHLIKTLKTLTPKIEAKVALENSTQQAINQPTNKAPVNTPPEPAQSMPDENSPYQPMQRRPDHHAAEPVQVEVNDKSYDQVKKNEPPITAEVNIHNEHVPAPTTSKLVGTNTKEINDGFEAARKKTEFTYGTVHTDLTYTVEEEKKLQAKVTDLVSKLNRALANYETSAAYVTQLNKNVMTYLEKIKKKKQTDPKAYSYALDRFKRLEDALRASGNYIAVDVFTQARSTFFSKSALPPPRYGRILPQAPTADETTRNEALLQASKSSVNTMDKLQQSVIQFNMTMTSLLTTLEEKVRQTLANTMHSNDKEGVRQQIAELLGYLKHYRTLNDRMAHINTPESLMNFLNDGLGQATLLTAFKHCHNDLGKFSKLVKQLGWMDPQIQKSLETPNRFLNTTVTAIQKLVNDAPLAVKETLRPIQEKVQQLVAEINPNAPHTQRQKRGATVYDAALEKLSKETAENKIRANTTPIPTKRK